MTAAAAAPFDGRFERVALPGGVRLHLSPSRKFKTAVVKVFLRTDLAAGTATRTALLPYVLRHGTAALPTLREVTMALEALYGTRLAADVIKLGEQQVVALRLDVLGDAYLPAGSDVLGRSVRLLFDLLLAPRREQGALPAAAVTTEKETLSRFLAGLVNDKAGWAAERCVRAMCPDEPYGTFEYGRVEDLAAIDGAALEARRQELLRGAEVDVYLAGPFEPGAAKALVADALAPLAVLGRTGPAPLRGTTPHPPARPVREVKETMAVKQARLVLGLRTPLRLADPGYFSLLVMNGVLGGFAHSKLFKNVREKAGLCYDASSTHERLKGLVMIACGVDAAKAARARDLCLAQVDAIAKGDVSPDELEQTKLAYAQGYRQLLDGPAQLVNLDYVMTLGGRSGAPDDVARATSTVTKDEVVEAARSLRLDTTYLLADGSDVPAAAPTPEPAA